MSQAAQVSKEIERWGCTNHPTATNIIYHPIRGKICGHCGQRITLLEVNHNV